MRTVAARLGRAGEPIWKFSGLYKKLWRSGWLTRTNRNRNTPQRSDAILLNTMPKSGSIYIQKSLAKILNCPAVHLGNGYALIDQMGVQDAKTLIAGGCVAQNHFAPSIENLQILQHFRLKMVLHLRDPRQALLSWVHSTDWVSGGRADSEMLLYSKPRPPVEYFERPLSGKIDWQIDNFLPQLIAWAARWLEIADYGTIPIWITHQDDLRTNEKTFFDSILAFYGLGRDYILPNLPRTMEDTHFRRADPMEWRQTLTPQQAARATSLIPASLQIRFGWGDSPPGPINAGGSHPAGLRTLHHENVNGQPKSKLSAKSGRCQFTEDCRF
jgi:hypothetical protein